MAALADYMHARNVSFGLYTAESPSTCAGYPGMSCRLQLNRGSVAHVSAASLNHEQHDAATFAAWVSPSLAPLRRV